MITLPPQSIVDALAEGLDVELRSFMRDPLAAAFNVGGLPLRVSRRVVAGIQDRSFEPLRESLRDIVRNVPSRIAFGELQFLSGSKLDLQRRRDFDPFDDHFGANSSSMSSRGKRPRTTKMLSHRSTKRKVSRAEVKKIVKKTLLKEMEAQHFISTSSGNTPNANDSVTSVGTLMFSTENKSEIAIGSQTAGYGNRSGNEITLKNIMTRLKFIMTAVGTSVFRLLIVLFPSEPRRGVPQIQDVLNCYDVPGGTTASVLLDIATYRAKLDLNGTSGEPNETYRILFDKLYRCSDGLAPELTTPLISLPVAGLKATYQSESALNTEIGNNSVWYWVISDKTGASRGSYNIMNKVKYSE